MARRLVAALGNPLLGDDGFGAAVLAALRSRSDLDLMDAGTDLFALVPELGRYEAVVLVDAVLDEGRSGEVLLADEATLSGWGGRSHGAHALDAAEAVRLFRALEPAAPTRITLVGLATDRIARTSAPLREAVVREGVRKVLRALEAQGEARSRKDASP